MMRTIGLLILLLRLAAGEETAAEAEATTAPAEGGDLTTGGPDDLTTGEPGATDAVAGTDGATGTDAGTGAPITPSTMRLDKLMFLWTQKNRPKTMHPFIFGKGRTDTYRAFLTEAPTYMGIPGAEIMPVHIFRWYEQARHEGEKSKNQAIRTFFRNLGVEIDKHARYFKKHGG